MCRASLGAPKHRLRKGVKQMLLAIQIIAAISALACVFVFVLSAFVASQLRDAKRARGLPSWKLLGLYNSRSVTPASRLVCHFHVSRYLILPAILLLCVAFIFVHVPHLAFRDPSYPRLHPAGYLKQVYNTMGAGIFFAWLSIFQAIRYGMLVDRNLIGGK